MSDFITGFCLTCFDFLTAVNIILIMQMFFGTGFFKKAWQRISFVVIFVLLHIVMYVGFSENTLLQFIINYGYILFIVLYLSPKRRIKTLFLLIPGMFIYTEWSFLVGMIKDILPWEIAPFAGTSSLGIVELITDMLLAGLIIFGIWWHLKKSWLRPISVGETIFLLIFSIISPFFGEIMNLLIQTNQDHFRQTVWTLFVLAINVLVVFAIIHRRNARYYKELSGNYKNQFDSEYSYFKQYKEEQKDVISFRHDFKNHMMVLQTMFEQKEYDKAKDYFEGLSDKMKQTEKHFLTGNEVVDIILNTKADQFDENNIMVECNGGLEVLQFMEAVDCCILFSNIIDNAIEANGQCENNRFICINTISNPGHFVVSVENAMEGEIIRTDDGLATTKEQEGHGIGTKNIFAIIKKYNGEYEINTKENIFSIQMLFPNS